MGSSASPVLMLSFLFCYVLMAAAGNFGQDFDLNWEVREQRFSTMGRFSLSLDRGSRSGFQSENEYLFTKVDMQLKLVPGNSVWFDPTVDFHTYSILWNPQRIMFLWFSGFYVDGTPIREFKNMESRGVQFSKTQPMRLHSSRWNADDWATRGSLVKADWSKAPFTASYRNFRPKRLFLVAWHFLLLPW